MAYMTPIYAAILGLILVYLSWRVVNLRNKYQIKRGDGGHEELMGTVRAQENLIEYLPTALVMMLMVELQGFSDWVIHMLGIVFVLARLLHLKGIHDPPGASKARRVSTRLTWAQMILTAGLCLYGSFIGIF